MGWTDIVSIVIAIAALALGIWNSVRLWQLDAPRLRIRPSGALTRVDPSVLVLPDVTIQLYNPGGRPITVVRAGFKWQSADELAPNRKDREGKRQFPATIEPRGRLEIHAEGLMSELVTRHQQGDPLLSLWAEDGSGKVHRINVDPDWATHFRRSWKEWSNRH